MLTPDDPLFVYFCPPLSHVQYVNQIICNIITYCRISGFKLKQLAAEICQKRIYIIFEIRRITFSRFMINNETCFFSLYFEQKPRKQRNHKTSIHLKAIFPKYLNKNIV